MILAVYADDSRDDELFTVGGFMGFPETFVEAERQWEAALKKEGIDYFKASECQRLDGQFHPTRLMMSPKSARAFAESVRYTLGKILIDNQLGGIGQSIDLKAFQEILRDDPDSKEYFMGTDPYIYSFICYIKTCIDLMNKDGEGLLKRIPVAFVLDQHSNWKAADDAYRMLKENPAYAHRLAAITHADDKHAIALQMADFCAYEARIQSHAKMKGQELRPIFTTMAQGNAFYYIGVQQKSTMLKLLALAKDHDRSRQGNEEDSVSIEDGIAAENRS